MKIWMRGLSHACAMDALANGCTGPTDVIMVRPRIPWGTDEAHETG